MLRPLEPLCCWALLSRSGAGSVSRQAGWLEKRMSQPELEAEVAQIVAESLAKTPPPPRPA